jgi:hypothetical protein
MDSIYVLRALGGDRAVLNGQAGGLFAHSDLHVRDREALQQLIGHGRRKRLQQLEAPLVHLAHGLDDEAVIDRALDAVVGAPLAHVELDVVEERLAVLALLRQHAVVPIELEPRQLDFHAVTAAAARSASTCSRTSCARRIVAPRS